MAILEGIEASVIIDGKALTEYDNEDTSDGGSDHTSEVSKYIEALPDAEFSMGITVPKSYSFVGNALCFKLSLDGVRVGTWLCRKAKLEDLRKDWHIFIAGSKVKNGEEWYLRPFRFDDIKIGETRFHILIFCIDLRNSVEASTSTASSKKSNSVANLGTITLNVYDHQVTRKIYSTGDEAVRVGQSSEIAETELRGRNVTLRAGYANLFVDDVRIVADTREALVKAVRLRSRIVITRSL